VKNPDYWKDDEKFPGNRLPYVDELKLLFIKERATLISALRTGKIPYIRGLSEDEYKGLKQSVPDLVVQNALQFRSTSSYGMSVMKAPFDDVRVRKAMQLAIDLDTLNKALYSGLGDMTPRGIFGGDTIGFHVPYDEWPEEVKQGYVYDPERAEKLLDEAGYPRGADGVRFTTQLQYTSASSGNLDWTQAAKDYWAQIGVDVEIDIQEIAVFISNINGRTWEGMSWGEYAANSNGLYYARTHGHSTGNWNFSAAAYPEIDALIEAAESAITLEEMQRLVREWDMYTIANHWGVYGGVGPAWVVWQPWLGGYNGELQLGAAAHYAIQARLWIDQDMKKAMGH
jgi:peptide/nickel transport system substrate-binding protein